MKRINNFKIFTENNKDAEFAKDYAEKLKKYKSKLKDDGFGGLDYDEKKEEEDKKEADKKDKKIKKPLD